MTTATFIIGGARSGKSRFAEQMALESGKRPIYIATAQAYDEEMENRITLHQNRRDDGWQTIEAPLDLVAAIDEAAADDVIILVDCLTLWLSNLILADEDVEISSQNLCAVVARPPCDMVMVANEVGLGIVPENALARRFRDEAGNLNQHIAACAQKVYLVAAGLPLLLKG